MVGCQSPKPGKHERENGLLSDHFYSEHGNIDVHVCKDLLSAQQLVAWHYLSSSHALAHLLKLSVPVRGKQTVETSHDTSKCFGFNCGQLSVWTFNPLLFLKP